MCKKGKHKSVDKSLKLHVDWIESLDIVKKVVIGISEACRHSFSPGHMKRQYDTEGGVMFNAYSGIGVTKIFIKTEQEDKEKLIELIEKRMK